MNVLEQHIEINLSSQKIASNVFRKFDPNELDWMLNKMVDRFIKDRIKEDKDSLGFDATEIDMDALRTLGVLDRALPVYKNALTDEQVYSDLPGDYAYMIDDYSGVVDKCSIYFTTGSKFTAKTKYLYMFEVKEATGNKPYYKSVTLQLNGSNLLSLTSLPDVNNKEEIFTFKNFILNTLWTSNFPGIEIYWEKYRDTYKRNNIIIVSDVALAGANSLTIGGDTSELTTATLSALYPTTLTAGVRNHTNRLIKGQARSNVLQGTFTRSQVNSPISAISGNKLKIYHDEKFIVNQTKISYIRKPRKISLSLGQDCDLPEEFHMQICDMTVLYIKELTMSPDWEVKLQDNMMNKN